jgi:hypothetical protein
MTRVEWRSVGTFNTFFLDPFVDFTAASIVDGW